MVKQRQAVIGLAAFAVAIAIASVHAQVGRGTTEWLTAGADAQRTSWIRTDPKISVASLSQPGFELQWTSKLGAAGLAPGVTANGVTLFIPMSVVASANAVYALDNDTGYVVWQRRFDTAATASSCGISAATRIVPLVPAPIAAPPAGRAGQPYRSVIGQPGEGAPVEVRGGGAGRAGAPPAAGTPAAAGPGTQGLPPVAPSGAQGGAPGLPPVAPSGAQGGAQRGGGGFNLPATAAIPGAKPEALGGGRGGLGRPSGVVYALSGDGVLHVLGLPSGKDIQKPAEFVPLKAGWSDTEAVNTTLYATSSAACGGGPNAVWAVDLESDSKPVVSWKSTGPIVGRLAFGSTGTVFASIGAGGIVALDPKTLALKDSFSKAGFDFATGPSVFKQNDREIVTAATKDGRVVLLDAAALGGADRATPLHVSAPAGAIAANALATWQELTITMPPPAPAAPAGTPAAPPGPPAQPIVTTGARWILAPVANGVAAMRLGDAGGTLSLERVWSAQNLASPATPIVVNGVVFALATGRAPTGRGTPAVLHAYDGTSGKELWTSGSGMKASASAGSFWSAMSQMYIGATDGTLYTFGFLDERRF